MAQFLAAVVDYIYRLGTTRSDSYFLAQPLALAQPWAQEWAAQVLKEQEQEQETSVLPSATPAWAAV